MSSSATTTGRSPRPWLSPFCFCSPVRSRSISTTTSSSSRPERDGEPLFPDAAHRAVPGHHAALFADGGADRVFVQRLTAGQRVGRVLDRLVFPAAAQPPAAAGGAAVAGSRCQRLRRRGGAGDVGGDC